MQRVNVEQQVYLDAKHAEITATMAQLSAQKVSLDATTEVFRFRDEEIRASILNKEVELAQLFQRSNADLQKTISVGRAEFQQLQQQLQASGGGAGRLHQGASESRAAKTLVDSRDFKFFPDA